MNKTTVNYWLDVVIGLAFVGSALSGLVFLLPTSPTTGVLGLSYRVWNDLHTWSSLALIVGVGAHLVLHGAWLVAMTRRMLPLRRRERIAPGLTCAEPKGAAMSRRAFLTLGGASVAALGLLGLAGARTIVETLIAPAGNSEAPPAPMGNVACPRGLVNDPYPGQCRLYVDSDGDGLCDYSVPGASSTLSPNSLPPTDRSSGGRRRRGS